jgi:hypothetical protein
LRGREEDRTETNEEEQKKEENVRQEITFKIVYFVQSGTLGSVVG